MGARDDARTLLGRVLSKIAPLLLASGVLVAACDRPESPEVALERTLVGLREGSVSPVQEPGRYPEPDSGLDNGAVAAGPRTAVGPSDPLGRSPTVTPYETPPSFSNRSEVQRVLMLEYPATLRDAGVGGTTLLDMFINSSGVLENVLVAQSSGHLQLDRAALRVALALGFTPAQNAGQPVPVWIQVPITFQANP